MKTMDTLLSRSLRLFLLLAVTSILPSTVVRAQSSTDAFYIYQNDGHFDGFFYDEVICIQYSKTDTLGIEHTDYVSQEIVTADSTYRFMLTAIDSVGFVQPEIKINERVRNMQTEGLAYSLYDTNGQQLTFRSRYSNEVTEEDFNVGDILVNYSFDDHDGFSGKVTGIRREGYFLIIDTDPITDPTEIYSQFITVEQYNATEDGWLLSRRIAGMPQLGLGRYAPPSVVHNAKRAGQYELDLLNFNFSSSIPLNNNKIDITLNPSIEGKFSIKATWNFPSYVGITAIARYGMGIGVDLDGDLDFEMNPPASGLVTIPLPAAAPLFQLELLPNMFLKGDAHLKMSLQSPKKRGKVWLTFEFKDYMPGMSFGSSDDKTIEDENDEEYYNEPNESSASLSFEGSIQTGVKFPINLKTNSLLSYVFKCAIGAFLYVGPKVSGNVSLDLKNVIAGDNTVYNNFKDSKLSLQLLSIDYEAKGTYKDSWWGGEKEVTFLQGGVEMFSPMNMYFFPQFDKWEVKNLSIGNYDNEGNPISTPCITVKPSVWTVFPVMVGIDTYEIGFDNKEKHVFTSWTPEKYWQFNRPWLSKDSNPLYQSLSGMSPGSYRFYPVFSFMGKTIKASPSFDYDVPGVYLTVDADTLVFGGNGGTRTFRIKTNAARLETQLPSSDADGNYTFERNGEQATLTLPKKEGILTGHTTLSIEAYNEKGEYCDNEYITILRQPSNHIGKISMNVKTENNTNSLYNFAYNLYEDVDIQLGNSTSENLIYRDSYKTDNNQTSVTKRLDLILDLSHPDSTDVYKNFSYQHIKSGTFFYEEKTERNEEVQNPDGSTTTVKHVMTSTATATVKKNLYSQNYWGDYSIGEFRSYWTQFNLSEGEQYSTESGVDVKYEYTHTINGEVEEHVVSEENPEFSLSIIRPDN